jgi:hypothetical protein
MTLGLNRSIIASLALSSLLGIGTVSAQTAVNAPQVYRLDKEGTFQRGCFDPCLCPIMERAAVRGTFVLTPAGSDPLFSYYKISDVNWTVALGDPEMRITGSGTYRIGGEFAVEQRLEMDLKVGDGPVEHFDSGRVVGEARFPAIDLAISIHGRYCFDTVIEVKASPVPPEEIRPYRLLSGSTFQRGCFDPCDCPLGEKRSIGGVFSLVPLQATPRFTEYAVVNARWLVAPESRVAGSGIAVRGFGFYRYGGEVASEQRLILDLLVGSEELTRYDSGTVPGGSGFPRIDALVSINGGVCFDTLIDVHAAPRRRPGFRIPPPALLFDP